MSVSKRIAILTGGGDVPGLNVCLKGLVYRTIDAGFVPYGVRKGWEGFINYNYNDPTTYADNFIELTKPVARTIDRVPGSFLHSSRLNPREVPFRSVPRFLRKTGVETQDLTNHIVTAIERLDFAAVIVVGDDDTLRYAAHLSNKGVPIIAIPKTVHNNIYGTDYTIGFSTGLARSVNFIHELRALAGSREQLVVVETFKNTGYSSLMTAFLAGVDRVIIPEVPYDPARLATFVQRDKGMNPNNYAVITVTDGSQIVPEKMLEYTPHLSPRSKSQVLKLLTEEKAAELGVEDDEFTLEEVVETGTNLAGSGMVAAEVLQHLLQEEVFMQSLTYLIRTGPPDGQDLLGATNFAIWATRMLQEKRFGRMTAYQRQYNLTDVDLNMVVQGQQQLDIDKMYDRDQYQPKIDLIWAAIED